MTKIKDLAHLKDILVWMLMMFCYFDYNIVAHHRYHDDDEINLVVVGGRDDAGPGCLQSPATKTPHPHS